MPKKGGPCKGGRPSLGDAKPRFGVRRKFFCDRKCSFRKTALNRPRDLVFHFGRGACIAAQDHNEREAQGFSRREGHTAMSKVGGLLVVTTMMVGGPALAE